MREYGDSLENCTFSVFPLWLQLLLILFQPTEALFKYWKEQNKGLKDIYDELMENLYKTAISQLNIEYIANEFVRSKTYDHENNTQHCKCYTCTNPTSLCSDFNLNHACSNKMGCRYVVNPPIQCKNIV